MNGLLYFLEKMNTVSELRYEEEAGQPIAHFKITRSAFTKDLVSAPSPAYTHIDDTRAI